mmetsp:Transcript_78287/g.227042  ORF Transcript_78287/g.227042 Transcript_78287/m.227042 type:complete len:329 (-) Transcript_78287:1998-2984(-)
MLDLAARMAVRLTVCGGELRRRVVSRSIFWRAEVGHRLEHVLIAPIVANAKDEVYIAVHLRDLLQDPRHGDALVDPTQLYLDIALPIQDIDIETEQQVLQVRRKLFCLHAAKVRVHIPVLPHKRAPLALNERPLRAFHKLSHDLEGIGLPSVVRVLNHAMPLPTHHRQLVVEAPLRCQAEALDGAEPILKHAAVAATEDHHRVPLVGTECAQTVEDLLVGGTSSALQIGNATLGCAVLAIQMARIGGQGPLVVEEKHSVLRAAVSAADCFDRQLLEVLCHDDRTNFGTEADILDADALLFACTAQVLQEVLEPFERRALCHVRQVAEV